MLWGPLVLAGDLGAAPRRATMATATACAPPRPIRWRSSPIDRSREWLKPVAGKPGVFQAAGIARTVSTQAPIDVEFSPFFSMHRRTYAAYWDVLTPAELDDAGARARPRSASACARSTRRRSSSVTIGDRESEKTFNQQGVETSVIRTDGRSGRRAIQWFSYDLPVERRRPRSRSSRPTTATSVGARSFDVLIDGQKLGVGVAAAEQRVEVLREGIRDPGGADADRKEC